MKAKRRYMGRLPIYPCSLSLSVLYLPVSLESDFPSSKSPSVSGYSARPAAENRSKVVSSRYLRCLGRPPLNRNSFQDVLRAYFQPIKNEDSRLDSYTTYKREVTDYDMDYVKNYDDDLNTTPISVRPLPSTSVAPQLVLGGGSVPCR